MPSMTQDMRVPGPVLIMRLMLGRGSSSATAASGTLCPPSSTEFIEPRQTATMADFGSLLIRAASEIC